MIVNRNSYLMFHMKHKKRQTIVKVQFLLLFMGALLTLSQNTNATDVCASNLLGANDTAIKLCPNDCKNAGATSWGNSWLGTSSMKCTEKYPKNTSGSVCGCTFTGCTDVDISYSYNSANPANWTASVWYTPCGGTKEAAFPYYAREWTDNHLSIAKGTRVRIGPEGTASNYVDEIPTGDHLYVVCGGTMAQGDERSHCEVVNSPPPLIKCTEVTIDYAPQTNVLADIYYTACGAAPNAEETHSVAYKKLSVMVQSDTNVRIGAIVKTIFEPYINKSMSGPKVNVLCSGTLGKSGTCKEVP